MYDFNSVEPARASLLNIADSTNLQSHEPANARPPDVDRVPGLQPFQRRMDEQLHQAKAELAQSEE